MKTTVNVKGGKKCKKNLIMKVSGDFFSGGNMYCRIHYKTVNEKQSIKPIFWNKFYFLAKD